MTPSTIAGRSTHARTAATKQARTAPRFARRVSGGMPGATSGASLTMPAGAMAGAGGTVVHAPFGLRVARRCAGVPDARLLERLVRGRLWIPLIGGMLILLVFLQLTLLSLNAGIGQSIETSSVLERKNSALALQVSKLSAGQRVEDVAAERGMVMPAAGSVTYADAGKVRPDVAARGITAPKVPDPVTRADGSVLRHDGTVVQPDGTVIRPDGTVVPPGTGTDTPTVDPTTGAPAAATAEPGTAAPAPAAPSAAGQATSDPAASVTAAPMVASTGGG
ncbi:Cell division protein FtsL [Paraconexibacter sp. AEG42_29]|uniref:Cell division protein FtsL n=1 Tax=Paraconexibacter sp. AEG42_29 TaxID=2997339 RepID=A0AAU7AUM6_9ACTN